MSRFSLVQEDLAGAASDEGYATAASDFYFVIDCTHTMQWVLDTICDNLMEVVKIFEDGGLRMRYGVLEFRDRKYNGGKAIRLKHHRFGKSFNFGRSYEDSETQCSGSHFTEDVSELSSVLKGLVAKEGGPPKESVFDALKHAVECPDWRDDATRIVVLFTDAEPHNPDTEVKSWQECIEIIENSGIDMLHLVVAEKHLDKYRKLRLIQGPNDEDLPGDLLSLGDSEHASESLKKVLEGIGYSSTRKAAMDNAKKGFRGT